MRPHALLILDLEGTIFRNALRLPGTEFDSTIWQAIATALGPAAVAEEIATHERWKADSYDSYVEWMLETIDIHVRHDLTQSVFEELIAKAEYQPHVVETVRSMDRARFEPVIVSGGFRELARRAQTDLSIKHAFAACEYMFTKSGHLAGYNLLPCDFAGKLDFIRLMLREYALGETDWVFIADGANDVPTAHAAPFSIGFRPDPKLAREVTASITSFEELPSLLETAARAIGEKT